MLARPWNSANTASLRLQTDATLPRLLSRDDPVSEAIVGAVEEIARTRELSMAIISTAWCLSKGVNPIVGLNSKERIDEIVKAASVVLTHDEIIKLEAAYLPKNVIGH